MEYDRTGFATAPDGTRLFYGVLGAGPVLVLDDGVGCDGWMWEHLQPHFAATHTVVHWHYRGHGRSGAPRDRARIGIVDLADDLVSVLDAVGTERPVHIGHSMGTQVALEEWHLYPKNVKGLVLLCGSFGHVTQSFRGVPILDAILPKLMGIVDKQPDLVRAIWSRIPPEMAFRAAMLAGDVDPDNVRREDMLPYLKHMTHVDFAMFLKMLRSAGDHSAEEYLKDIDVPVLIVAGEKDTFTPGSLSTWMAEQIPGSELLVVPAGTHVAPIEQPELIGARIKAFVERAAAS